MPALQPRVAVLLSWLALQSWLQGVCGQTETVIVTDSQALADAVAAWGSAGGLLTLQLATPFLSMCNTTFRKPTGVKEPFSSGQLTIMGSSPEQLTVLDCCMRGGLTPPLTGAELVLKDIIMVNSCELLDSTPIYSRSTALLAGIFTPSLVYQSKQYNNYVLYMRQSEFSLQVYLGIVQRVKFDPLMQLAGPLLVNRPHYHANVSWVNTYSTLVNNYVAVPSEGYNLTLKSLANPSDPLLQQLSAQGLLLKPQLCNGTVLPESASTAKVEPFAPMWLSGNTQEFSESLEAAISFGSEKSSTWRAPPAVFLTSNATLGGNTSFPTLSSPVLITGPTNDHPAFQVTVQLDLGQAKGILGLNSTQLLFIQKLVLTNLATHTTPVLPQLASVLPLAAFRPVASWNNILTTPSYIYLDNMTLICPPADYLALLALGLKDQSAGSANCADSAVLRQAALLETGIQQLTVDSLDPNHQWMLLEHLIGWGINATSLYLLPSVPVSKLTVCSTRNGLSRGQIIALAVALPVGFVVLVVLFIGLLRWKPWGPAGLADHNVKGIPSSASATSRSAPSFIPTWIHVFSPVGLGSSQGTPCMDDNTSVVAHTSALNLHSCQDAEQGCQYDTSNAADATGSSPATAGRARMDALLNPADSSSPTTSSKRQAGRQGQADNAPPAEPSLDSIPSTVLLSFDEGMGIDLPANIAKRKATGIDDSDKVVITGTLGQGSWGSVYKGEWRNLSIALKTCLFESPQEGSDRADPTPGHTSQSRAVQEAAIAWGLRHRNIVSTYRYDVKPVQTCADGGLKVEMSEEVGSQEGVQTPYKVFKLFLVQELCTAVLSTILQQRILHEPYLDRMSILQLLLDIANGLQYLHGKNIIHGDLKPANVLLKSDPTKPWKFVAKLTDFGLSCHLPGGATHLSNFKSGTPFYVAPEVVNHSRTSPAADVFSFGVILWQVFSGRAPYMKAPDGGLQWNPAFPTFHPPVTPCPAYQELMHRCLQVEPQGRPTSSEIVKLLEAMEADLMAS